MKYIIVVLLILIITGIVLLANRAKKTSSDILFVPEGISDARVANLKLKQKPDEPLGILDVRRIKFPAINEATAANGDYRGVHELEWIVDIIPDKGFLFNKNEFIKIFDYNWRTDFESQFYAYFPSTQRWSFAISGDSPEQFDSLELAVSLAPVFGNEEDLTVERLQKYLIELQKRLGAFNGKFHITPRETPEIAVKRSKTLRALQRELNSDVIIVLRSNSKFRSDQFWNTLTDLGLKWGDGDLFHWTNYESGVGDDNFFSVWTSTEPGYFLPEDVANGTMNPEDLIFGFSIPRSPDPNNVFEIVVESAEFCRSKLGGTIVDENGAPFDKEKYRDKIGKVMSKMSESGFEHGQGLILRLI